MKKIVWTFGLIAGLISSLWVVIFSQMDKVSFDNGELLGYSSMIISFSMIFFAVRSYRDKHLGGSITFGKAFKTGLFISLIASSMYVITWLIEYYYFIPDFWQKYMAHMAGEMQDAGKSAEEIQKASATLEGYREMYKNPFINAVFTYIEIFPVGLLVSLITAAFLKRKPAQPAPAF